MKLPPDAADSDGPNLTPVIDVVFLLLIFFLVATQYNQEEREVDITLPEVAEAQPLSMTSEIIVNITNDGKYKVATKEYSEAQLASLISQAKKNNPHQTTLIRGDGESNLKFAVRVMGMCNKVQMDYRIAALQDR
jgi:biopolymer transport protein ExbD